MPSPCDNPTPLFAPLALTSSNAAIPAIRGLLGALASYRTAVGAAQVRMGAEYVSLSVCVSTVVPSLLCAGFGCVPRRRTGRIQAEAPRLAAGEERGLNHATRHCVRQLLPPGPHLQTPAGALRSRCRRSHSGDRW